ncbi:hypothetical protein [Methylobacterium sp. WL6]|uniref:hypothetical protein n=1 Tax=Methylobacterium sp. WL6 TaxID=2603901 RepID=UPI0011CCA583|nr:hypothetical protein [Methylobacterium sp. WL6]
MHWYFGYSINQVVVLTADEFLDGVPIVTSRGFEVRCEAHCDADDIHDAPYGPRIAPSWDEEDLAEHNRLRAASRDVELINCLAGAYAEAAFRGVSVATCLKGGGKGDLSHFHTIAGAWGWGQRSTESARAKQLAGARAEALIRSPMGAAAIKSIAESLLERGKVDEDEIGRLCRTAYGDKQCKPAVWPGHWPPTLAQIHAGHIPESADRLRAAS